VIATGTVLALSGATGADPAPGGNSSQPALRLAYDGHQVVRFADHPAARMVDRDTLTLTATGHIPQFGGAYIDAETETLHVWLTRPAQQLGRDVQAALAGAGEPGIVAVGNVVVHPADYTFAQLKAWKDAAMALFTLPEVALLSISERTNRLLVGFRGQDVIPPGAATLLDELGIPAAAVVTVNVQRPVTPLLRDRTRPMTGGTQIQFQTGVGGLSTSTCTLGFPAIRNGLLGFVTNAHCSRTRADVDNGRYWQPTRPNFDTDQVGTETVDPPFFTGGGCPEGSVCSFTDAIFVRAHDGVGVNRGRLASVPCCGSLNWNGTSVWRISENGFTFTGNAVRKVGRTSGTTVGTVDDICATIGVTDTNIVMGCQDLITATSDPGDSGSPVFEITHTPATNDVRAVGILWGGGVIDGVEVSVITPTPFVRDVITGPGLCAPGFSC
jgi:hypothetical protein